MTTVLSSAPAFSGFAVKDAAAARAFYADTLGLDLREGDMGIMRLHLAGGREVIVYESPAHTPASYTILNFPVADVAAAVDELAGRGVTFERYEGADQDERGIFRGGGPLIAWFTDPSGNVLSVIAAD